jgi:hypothetical protein
MPHFDVFYSGLSLSMCVDCLSTCYSMFCDFAHDVIVSCPLSRLCDRAVEVRVGRVKLPHLGCGLPMRTASFESENAHTQSHLQQFWKPFPRRRGSGVSPWGTPRFLLQPICKASKGRRTFFDSSTLFCMNPSANQRYLHRNNGHSIHDHIQARYQEPPSRPSPRQPREI